MAKKNEAISEVKAELKFTKTQLMKSDRYVGRSDVLSALLKDGELYSFEQADTIIDNFRKGKVR